MTTSRTRAFVLLGVAFAIGAFAGGAAIAAADRSGGPGRGRFGFEGRYPGWMRALELSPTVRDSVMALYRCDGVVIDSIHRTIRPAMDSLYGVIKPAVDARRAETRQQVRALLNAVQQERYDSIVQSQDNQRQFARPRPPVCTGG